VGAAAPSSVGSGSGSAPADVAPMGNGPMGGSAQGSGRANSANPGMDGTRSNVPAATSGPADSTSNSTTGSSDGDLSLNSHGVVGLSHLSLSAGGGTNPQGSVITSTGKNVHLDTGTRLILVTQAATAN